MCHMTLTNHLLARVSDHLWIPFLTEIKLICLRIKQTRSISCNTPCAIRTPTVIPSAVVYISVLRNHTCPLHTTEVQRCTEKIWSEIEGPRSLRMDGL